MFSATFSTSGEKAMDISKGQDCKGAGNVAEGWD